MRKIKLVKADIAEVEALQRELVNFVSYKNATLPVLKSSDAFFSSVLIIDIAQNLCYFLRRIIENKTGASNITLSASEACILMQCCSHATKYHADFEKYTMQKYTALLHKELINLI